MNHEAAQAALASCTHWYKSSRSDGATNCVEISTELAGWHKSSHSDGANNCVEISAARGGWIGVRDSKQGADSPVLAYPTTGWRALIAGVLNA